MSASRMPRESSDRGHLQGRKDSNHIGASPIVGNSAPTIRRFLGISTSTERPSATVTITRLMEESRSRTTFESMSIVAAAHIAPPQSASGKGASDAQRVVTIIPIVVS